MKFSLESEHTTLKYKLLRYFKKNSSHHRQSYTQQDSRIDEGFHQQKSSNTSCPSLITTSTYLSATSSSSSTTDQTRKIGRTRNLHEKTYPLIHHKTQIFYMNCLWSWLIWFYHIAMNELYLNQHLYPNDGTCYVKTTIFGISCTSNIMVLCIPQQTTPLSTTSIYMRERRNYWEDGSMASSKCKPSWAIQIASTVYSSIPTRLLQAAEIVLSNSGT